MTRAALIALSLALVAACGACRNDAIEYALFLDKTIACDNLRADSAYGEAAICSRHIVGRVPDSDGIQRDERWLCVSKPRVCWVIGAKIEHVLVVPKIPSTVPAEAEGPK